MLKTLRFGAICCRWSVRLVVWVEPSNGGDAGMGAGGRGGTTGVGGQAGTGAGGRGGGSAGAARGAPGPAARREPAASRARQAAAAVTAGGTARRGGGAAGRGGGGRRGRARWQRGGGGARAAAVLAAAGARCRRPRRRRRRGGAREPAVRAAAAVPAAAPGEVARPVAAAARAEPAGRRRARRRDFVRARRRSVSDGLSLRLRRPGRAPDVHVPQGVHQRQRMHRAERDVRLLAVGTGAPNLRQRLLLSCAADLRRRAAAHRSEQAQMPLVLLRSPLSFLRNCDRPARIRGSDRAHQENQAPGRRGMHDAVPVRTIMRQSVGLLLLLAVGACGSTAQPGHDGGGGSGAGGSGGGTGGGAAMAARRRRGIGGARRRWRHGRLRAESGLVSRLRARHRRLLRRRLSRRGLPSSRMAEPVARPGRAARLAPAARRAWRQLRQGRRRWSQRWIGRDRRIGLVRRARLHEQRALRASELRRHGSAVQSRFPTAASVRTDGPIGLSATGCRHRDLGAKSRRARLPVLTASRDRRRAAPR